MTSYSLTLNVTHLQPCQRDVGVAYTAPQPPASAGGPSTVARAAVRLYRREGRSFPAAGEPTLPAAVPATPVYVAERPVAGSRGLVSFPCRLFDVDYFYYYQEVGEDDVTVVGYCFRLVSVATNGGIAERTERCLPLTRSQQGVFTCVLTEEHSTVRMPTPEAKQPSTG